MRWTALVLLVSVTLGCGEREAPPRSTQGPARQVSTARVTREDVNERLEAGGVVAATESATITSRVLAPILELRARPGDRVRAGEVLVVLEGRDLAARARQAASSLTAAEQAVAAARTEQAAAAAEQKVAQAWHGRIAALRSRNSATAQELEDAEARLASASARVEGTQARIEQATAGVGAARAAAEAAAATEAYATIEAPFDGVVTERLTDPGNLASPGTPLLQLESAGAGRVELMVDESRVPYVRTGDSVAVVLDGSDGTGEPRVVEGSVVEVARAVDADARAFLVKVSLPRGLDVRSGTFARVRFAGAMREALRVPASAIRRQGQVVTVFVVAEGVARLRLVRVADSGGETVEVLAGLDEGEAVVTAPPPDLVDGSPVTTAAPARGEPS